MRSGFLKLAASSIVILLAVLIALYAFNYLRFGETDFLSAKDPVVRANTFWKILFYLHVLFGGIALLVGGFQFVEPLRNRFLAWHRRVGKVYVASVLISSTAGFLIALFAEAGPIAKAGFALLAMLWFWTTFKAFSEIRKWNVTEHRAWMIRSYSLTFAAVTLRFWLPVELALLGLNFLDAYRIVAWLCWVPNLAVAELLVYRMRASLSLSSTA